MSCLSCNLYLQCVRLEKRTFSGCARHIPIADYSHDLMAEMLATTSLVPAGSGASPVVMASDDEADQEGSLLSLVDTILSNKGGSGLVPPDIRIDDRDIPEPASFYEWSVRPDMSGVTPFARQLWLGARTFAEICEHCSPDPTWARNIMAVPVNASLGELGERIQFLSHGVCPSCGRTKVDLFRSKHLDPYYEVCLVIGQRAGKSAFVSFCGGYHQARMLKMQDPTKVYGLPSNQTLSCTFVGLTFRNAVTLLWSPVRQLILTSPWFKQYHNMLNHYGKRYGEELYRVSELQLHYRHRQLLMYPMGADKRKLRGESRYMSAIDELGWWPMGDNDTHGEDMEKSGSEVYGALDRSLKTVRAAADGLWRRGYPNVPTAYAFNVSSPSSRLDMIMRLYRASQHSRRLHGVQLPTWEINPGLPRAAFNPDFLKDPVKAERDYGANPPVGSNPFIAGSTAVDASWSLTPPGLSVVNEFSQSTHPGAPQLRQAAKLVGTYRTGRDLPPMICAIDAGTHNNSFAVVIGHRVQPKVGALPKLVFPVMLEVVPSNGAVLSLNRVFRQVIIPLFPMLNIRALVADRWNSKMMLDATNEEHNVWAEQYSVRLPDFHAFKSYLEGGLMAFPSMKGTALAALNFNPENYPHCFEGMPSDHLYMQVHSVVDAGKTVVKGTGLTDDLFRAAVLATHFLLDADWAALHLKDIQKRRTIAVGCVGGLSSGMVGGGGAAHVGAVRGLSS